MHSTLTIPKLKLKDVPEYLEVFSHFPTEEEDFPNWTYSITSPALDIVTTTGLTNWLTYCRQPMRSILDEEQQRGIPVQSLVRMLRTPAFIFLINMKVNATEEVPWVPFQEDEIEKLRKLAEKSRYHSPDFDVDLQSEVLQFGYENQIMEYMKISIDLIKNIFTSLRDISAEIMEDDEIADRWMVFNIYVQDEIDNILDMYDRYTEEWVARVPWPERSKIRISFYSV